MPYLSTPPGFLQLFERAPRNSEALPPNPFAAATLERHKREGMELAVRARWIALAIIAVMLPILNPDWAVVYYLGCLGLLALIGWLQWRVARVGQSGPELALLMADIVLLTLIFLVPNPLAPDVLPSAANYRFEGFLYFFVTLAAGTLAYSWRTIMAIGNWTAAAWLLGALTVWLLGRTDPAIDDGLAQVYAAHPVLADFYNPNLVQFNIRFQEVIVFVIVAYTLAMTVRRFNQLVLDTSALERERANLSRYFSPNVVAALSQNDEPLKQVQTQDIAVLFVDIVGFTSFAEGRSPEQVIEALRAFHARMSDAVFAHDGTLDKYLGDGLMATFGTPSTGPHDAGNALRAVRQMQGALAAWNAERRLAGEPEIKASFGLHFGPVVLGNIGSGRLEWAVIGTTVNIASRLGGLTRELPGNVAFSAALRDRVLAEGGNGDDLLSDAVPLGPHHLRGLQQPTEVWSFAL